MNNFKKIFALLSIILLSSCDSSTPTANFENNCDCYKGSSLAEVVKLPSDEKPLVPALCSEEPMLVGLRFLDKNGIDLLYNLPNNTPIKLCNAKTTVTTYIVKDDKRKIAYLNANKISEISVLTNLVKEKTFCLTIGNILQGTVYMDYQYVFKKPCTVIERASLSFNGVEFSQQVYDAGFNTLINTITIK